MERSFKCAVWDRNNVLFGKGTRFREESPSMCRASSSSQEFGTFSSTPLVRCDGYGMCFGVVLVDTGIYSEMTGIRIVTGSGYGGLAERNGWW